MNGRKNAGGGKIAAMAFAALLALGGCGRTGPAEADAADADGQELLTAGEEGYADGQDALPPESGEVSYSVWNAYWNLEGAEEQTEELSAHIQNINFFAAYFDKDDKVFIPQETLDFYEKNGEAYKKRGWNCYLTVVNDKINEDQTSSLKSAELVYRLTGQEESYKAHAEELTALAVQHGFDGLEIDYENIQKDSTLWKYFMDFIDYLYERCTEEGLLLRVVIETNIEPDKIEWVEGPVYCVMCYNLYGSHSGPGPKADRDFLTSVMEKMSPVPGKVDYALANGGFDWSGDGAVTQLTVKQAQDLRAAYDADLMEDPASAAKYYDYTDENGESHEVWYGDQETLETWMSWLQEQGNWEYSIWRVGE